MHVRSGVVWCGVVWCGAEAKWSLTDLVDDCGHPLLHRVPPHLVVAAHPDPFLERQPHRYPTVVPLRTYVRPNTEVGEQSRFGNGVGEQGEVVPAGPVERALYRRVPVPEDGYLNHVDAVVTCGLHEDGPHGGRGAWVVDGAGHEQDRLVVQAE